MPVTHARLTLALALVLAPALHAAQPDPQTGTSSPPIKDDLFAGTEKFANGASEVTEINQDPQALGMVGGRNSSRARNTILNVVRTYEYDKPGMYNIADVEAIRNRLNTGEWHCTIHTRDLKHGESTDVCYKTRTDGLRENAVITVEPKQLTFIHKISKAGEGSWSGPSAPPAPPDHASLVLPYIPNVEATMHAALDGLPRNWTFQAETQLPLIEARLAIEAARREAAEARGEADWHRYADR